MLLHVSNTLCSSSGGQNCVTRPLVSSDLYVAVSCTGLHVSSIRAHHHQEVKIVLHSLWYHHTETSEWSKITKIQFYKYEHIVVKFIYEFFVCDYCILHYILESIPHPFYSFSGLKNQMRKSFAVVSWILKKLYSRCAYRKNNKIQ